METVTDKKNLLASLEEAFAQRGHHQDARRSKAMKLLSAKGLPTSKSEEYRFTPVVRALENTLNLEVPASISNIASLELIPGVSCNRVVFINGVYAPEQAQLLDKNLSITLTEAEEASADQDPFDLLNRAFTGPVVHVKIGNHETAQHPVAFVYYFDSPSFVFANPRWVCTTGTGSKLTVLEHTIARTAAYFNNKQSRIEVGENADLSFVMIQQGGREEILVNNAQLDLASSSRVSCYTCTLEGKMVRNNLALALNGEGIDAHLHGIYLVSGNNLVDNHSVVDHRKPNSYSNELYKGILDANGKAVFNGKIFVRPDAQKTNAFQSNRNILLTDTSTIHTKPQLEIWADDVKCSHGCTTGQLDEEALFYLRSRGIDKDAARGMLLTAFASETLEGLKDENLRAFTEALILKKLHPANPS
jgi:Fe-S cluster assembly protein SufD